MVLVGFPGVAHLVTVLASVTDGREGIEKYEKEKREGGREGIENYRRRSKYTPK